MPVSSWSTTPSNNNAAPPNGAPEGMTPGNVNDVIRQIMADVRSFYDNTALKDASNTLTGSRQTVSAGNAQLVLQDTTQAANSRNWVVWNAAGPWKVSAYNDAFSVGADAITIARTGTTIDSINLQATTVQANGSAVATITTGSFTGTLTGMDSATTGTVNYRIDGNTVSLFVNSGISGTSNSTALTMTGLPAAVRPANLKAVATTYLVDNGNIAGGNASVASSGTITFGKGIDGNVAGFTASSTKGLNAGWSITYPLS